MRAVATKFVAAEERSPESDCHRDVTQKTFKFLMIYFVGKNVFFLAKRDKAIDFFIEN